MQRMQIIGLLTDYGMRDYYAGALKGVILGLVAKVQVVDITHDIDPHNILHGAFVLRQVWPWYPAGTIFVAVVDPGVGSSRRIILGQYAGRYVIAPDNGLVTLLHRDFPVEAMHVVEERRFFLPELSATFHGRDMMAPAAAHLANGVKPREFGRATDRLEMLPLAHCADSTGGSLSGRVLYVDRFGTMVTNIRQEQLRSPRVQERAPSVIVNGRNIGPVRAAFHEVAVGEPIALLGSAGLLEIAVNQGRAVDQFGPLGTTSVEIR